MVDGGVVMTAMAKAGLSVATKELMSRVLKGWGNSNLSGRKAVRYLNSDDGFINYLTKHVAMVTRIRTIHSNECDVFLDDIYYPLHIESSSTPIERSKILCIDDDFITFNDDFVNIIGIAGQGKSTILRKIFKGLIKNDDRLPFFLELRKIDSDGVLNGLMNVFNSIGMNVNESSTIEILRENKLILLLDAFDEISSEKRRKILNEILEVHVRFGTKIITTSRPETDICHTPNIKNYKVRNLSKKDIIGIIRKLKESNSAIIKEDTDGLIKKIESEEKLVRVMVSPILVTLLYISYPYMDLIPNNTIEFYQNLFNTLYIRHDKIKNYSREKKSSLSNKEAYDVFCAFSFISLQKNQLTMTSGEMLDNVGLSLKSTKLERKDPSESERLCEDFIDVTCLLLKDGYMKYSFLHKSICEFHAADFIKNTPIEIKKKFYDMISDKLIKNDVGVVNLVLFLIDMDGHDSAKYLILPLLDKAGVNFWDDPSDVIVDDLIKELIDGSTVYFDSNDGVISMSRILWGEGVIWLDVFSNGRINISDMYGCLVEPFIVDGRDYSEFYNGDVNGVNMELLINDDFLFPIRKKLRVLMTDIYNDIYKDNQEKILSKEESMLSLLSI